MEEVIKQKSLNREEVTEITEVIEITAAKTPFSDLDEEVKLAIHSAAEKKAVDIVALDLREITSFAEFFIIANGTNSRQVQAIADEISEQLKKQLKKTAIRIEGYAGAEWVLLDYGDFIFHVFNTESRKFYNLERLWRDAVRVEMSEDL